MTSKTTAPNTQPTTTTTGFTASTSQDGERIASQLAFLTRVLKMPTIAKTWSEIADQARDLG